MVQPPNPLRLINPNMKEFGDKHKAITERTRYRVGIGDVGRHWDDRTPIQKELVEAVNTIKTKFPGAVVVEPPDGGVKSFESAQRKVQDKKINGDWSQLNDLSRCTLVVMKHDQLDDALASVIAYFSRGRSSGSLRFLFSKPILATDKINNPCGYSHEAVALETPDHQRAEVQINLPGIMIAKSLKECIKVLPGELLQATTNQSAPVLGGLGHDLYEVWRVQKIAPIGIDAAAASCLYYEYFRRPERRTDQSVDELRQAIRKAGLVVHW